MADTLDRNGVKNIYLTKQGGREWVIEDHDTDEDPQFECNKEVIKLVDNYYSLRDYEEASVDILIPEYAPAPANSSHAAAVARGWMTSPADWGEAVEMTVMFNATVAIPNTNPFGMQGPTGEHPTNSPHCTGSGYGCFVHFYANPVHVYFFKEQYHQQFIYAPPVAVPSFDFELNAHGDIGNKFIIFLKYGPDRNFVKLEHWMNGNGDKVTWVKVNEMTDNGDNLGGYDSSCAGTGTGTINYRNGKMRLLMDWTQTDLKFKHLSVREVTRDPNEIPVQPPVVVPPPQAGLYRRIYSIIYDMGEFEGDECLIAPEGGGGPEPITYEVYNVAASGGADTPLNEGTHRQGIYLQYAESQLVGERPAEIEWELQKVGSPPSTQAITCHIRRGTDDAIVETFDWENGVLTPDLLTTTATYYLFENPDANYALQEGDYVTVEWTGCTSSSHYVKVGENVNNPFDGANTCKRKYDSGGPPPTDWGTKSDSRDLAAIIRAKG